MQADSQPKSVGLVLHVSGAGAENGAERARKPDERERDLKKYGGAGAEREREVA